MAQTPEYKLMKHVKKTDTCWLWQGTLHYGYGSVKRVVDGKQKRFRAHRLAYEMFVGPIPDGMVVMHKCDVRACVNPDHLEVGTYADNNQDMWEKGRGRNGGTFPGRRLTEDEASECRAVFLDLVNKYGVAPTTVAKAMQGLPQGQTWVRTESGSEAPSRAF